MKKLLFCQQATITFLEHLIFPAKRELLPRTPLFAWNTSFCQHHIRSEHRGKLRRRNLRSVQVNRFKFKFHRSFIQ